MNDITAASEEFKRKFDSIFVRKGSILEKVNLIDIDLIKSEGNYCIIQAGDKQFVMKKSLVRMVDLLPSDLFFRVHMRNIVAINKINKIDLSKNLVHLKDNEIPIGPRYRSEILKRITTK